MKKLLVLLVIIFCFNSLYADVVSLVQKAAENVKFPVKVVFIADEEISEFKEIGSSEVVGKYISTKKFEYFDEDSHTVEVLSEKYVGEYSDEDSSGGNENEGSYSMDDPDSPFALEGMKLYDYSDGGIVKHNGKDLRKVIFNPKKKSKESFKGYGLLEESSGKIYKVSMELSKLPLVLKDFRMSYEFTHENGYTIPTLFDMDIAIKIILVAEKSLNIKTKFREYEIKDA